MAAVGAAGRRFAEMAAAAGAEPGPACAGQSQRAGRGRGGYASGGGYASASDARARDIPDSLDFRVTVAPLGHSSRSSRPSPHQGSGLFSSSRHRLAVPLSRLLLRVAPGVRAGP